MNFMHFVYFYATRFLSRVVLYLFSLVFQGKKSVKYAIVVNPSMTNFTYFVYFYATKLVLTLIFIQFYFEMHICDRSDRFNAEFHTLCTFLHKEFSVYSDIIFIQFVLKKLKTVIYAIEMIASKMNLEDFLHSYATRFLFRVSVVLKGEMWVYVRCQ